MNFIFFKSILIEYCIKLRYITIIEVIIWWKIREIFCNNMKKKKKNRLIAQQRWRSEDYECKCELGAVQANNVCTRIVSNKFLFILLKSYRRSWIEICKERWCRNLYNSIISNVLEIIVTNCKCICIVYFIE